MSIKEDEDGYIHLTAHPDKLALECQNKEGSSKYSCNSSSDSDSCGEDLVESRQRRSRRIGYVDTVDNGRHRYVCKELIFHRILFFKGCTGQ